VERLEEADSAMTETTVSMDFTFAPRLGVELYPGRWAKSATAYGNADDGTYFVAVVYHPTRKECYS
jgi:hypothetical protein